MKEIELFNSLNFSNIINFNKHLFNIQQNHTYFIINAYLDKIIDNNRQNEVSTTDFILLLTIYHYNKEFVLIEDEKIKIKNYIDKFYYINNSNNINILEYYNNNIKNLNNEIIQILKNVLDKTLNITIEHYITMYYFYNNLYIEIKDFEENKEIIEKKETYYNLLKKLLSQDSIFTIGRTEIDINIDIYIKNKVKELKLENRYETFRKEIFFNMLEKDLNKEQINYDSIIYLLDIIRIKLCNIAPNNDKYKYITTNINNILDIKYIKQQITNEVFDYKNTINIFNFIIETIKQFQSENDDKKLEEIENIIKNEYLNNNINNINIILPNIMRNIIDIVDKLEHEVIYYRNKFNSHIII
jgi:hypothetical protein